MLATLGDLPLDEASYAYEPKYDGIRALVGIEPGRATGGITLWSRLGNEKTSQFPEIVQALVQFASGLRRPLILDGEVVALDAHGQPAGFQQLQGRIHLTAGTPPAAAKAALILFDILRIGDDDVRDLPLRERRELLERIVRTRDPRLRLSEYAPAGGTTLEQRALEHGWEGLIAKRLDSSYRTSRRSPDWIKLKLVRSQEFVIGGWTEPRGVRGYFGALLLGVYRDGALEYVGHTGTGFDERELRRVWGLLRPLETKTHPFRVRPKTNQPPHWVQPKLVAEVKFTEWTHDDKLRHPTYIGLRDDIDPLTIIREPQPERRRASAKRPMKSAHRSRGGAELKFGPTTRRTNPTTRRATPATGRASPATELKFGPTNGRASPATELKFGPTTGRASRTTRRASARVPPVAPELQFRRKDLDKLIEQLNDIQDRGGTGMLQLPDGDQLQVTNLKKAFWPELRLTKGDLIRFYVRMAPFILPVVADRPLVMKRFPNGVHGQPFYQQRGPSPVPPGIRVEVVPGDEEVPNRIVGGSLKTLLYMAQLAAISQDPWFSRVTAPAAVDHIAIDLDPMPGVEFSTVLDVARWVRDELDALGAHGFPKTSGADGLHVYVPMPPGTPYDAGLLYAQIVATMVAQKHPKAATVERTVRARGQRVYVDYLQNIRGKTLACAYSARASEFAGVSTPLSWQEVEGGVDRRDFTILTLPDRLASVGDLWAELRRSKGADLMNVQAYLDKKRSPKKT